MKKLMLLLLVLPFVSWAQNDSLKLEKKKPIILKSISSNALPNPLMVVDGTVVDYDKTINEINPDEIESITVLKNENAIEKYGEEGKNGVIEIHLKEKKDSSNLTEVLSGTVIPGLKNTNSPSQPIYIRCGLPSMDSQNGKPLYVVDGNLKTINHSLEDEINPEEIGDIIVLKDVSATTLYGRRRNGVIIIRTKKYLEELEIQKNPYDLTVSDLGYESFLAMQPSAKTYSLSYLQNKNKQYVSVWNSRVNTGNPDIYEMRIDYDSQTYYGLEFEYKLFQFFKFMEDKYLISFNS